MKLPPHLAAWAEQLALLDPACATALGPVVRGVDGLLGGEPRTARPDGEPDGYDGLTNRGTPERLLMSQWLLAEEAPEEFLRRAARRELLHLAPAHTSRDRRGRIAVLTDTGPSQLGAARLVQLAALLVAHRRATARGTTLLLGVLGHGEPGTWHAGDLPEQLRLWLRARSAAEPDPRELTAWTDTLDRADDCWLLAGALLAAHPAAHRLKTLTAGETAWTETGASALTVRWAGRRARLAMPDPRAAVRILRGTGWRRTETAAHPLPAPGTGPLLFPGNGNRLAFTSADGQELITVQLPDEPGNAAYARPRRHRLMGPALAVGQHGRRLLVLCRTGPYLRLQVIGKPFPAADGFRVTARDLYPDDEGHILDPIIGHAHAMLLRRSGAWWRLPLKGAPTEAPEILWALPGERGDAPRLAHLPGDHADGMRIVLAPGGTYAWSADGESWRFTGPDGEHPVTRKTAAGESVCGAVLLAGHAHLVTRSPAGQLVRLRGPVRDAALTRWSGTPLPPAVHPLRPLLAVRRDDGTVEVANVEKDVRLLVLRGTR
ncbi:hypothetical protein SRB5_38700 [Streptomyces sp. RB5]|uniref:Uncharacterized protein n=1 Tax=Streptomyces smaragdinus TaxID=2585196 RepID=A0A7K0CJQ4_9ACTN|nr:hypothetical protein [Streptomyces smaragdinus]MQY13719.1 hypothetical protein [Streptomyces smaragdinus]